MTSFFTWLDTSEADRRRALDAVDLFRRRGTLDELGMGVIRDAIADCLFPGTSTIQTRARYFLFVPWTYLELEARAPLRDVARLARRAELHLSLVLAAGSEADGVIGRVAGEGLQRLPSSIYWAGLGAWGVRLFPGSRASYHRHLERSPVAERNGNGRRGNWHPHVPPVPDGHPERATLDLRRDEAEFLRDRIELHQPASFLAHMLRHTTAGTHADAPWLHPAAENAPATTQDLLEDARRLAELSHGAALLYNLLVARTLYRDSGATTVRDFEVRLAAWTDSVRGPGGDLRQLGLDALWERVSLTRGARSYSCRTFLHHWQELVCGDHAPPDLGRSRRASRLIREQEANVKGPGRARLEGAEHLKEWSGASGIEPLQFRWPQAQQIVADIIEALGREEHDALSA